MRPREGVTGRIEIALLRDGYRTHAFRPRCEVTWCDREKAEIILHRHYGRMRYREQETEVYVTVGARCEVTCGMCIEAMEAAGEEEWT